LSLITPDESPATVIGTPAWNSAGRPRVQHPVGAL